MLQSKRAILEKEQARLEYERGANEILREAQKEAAAEPPAAAAAHRGPLGEEGARNRQWNVCLSGCLVLKSHLCVCVYIMCAYVCYSGQFSLV